MRCVYADEDADAVDRKQVCLSQLWCCMCCRQQYCTSHHDLFSQAIQSLLRQGSRVHTPKVLLQASAFCVYMSVLHWIMQQGH